MIVYELGSIISQKNLKILSIEGTQKFLSKNVIFPIPYVLNHEGTNNGKEYGH